MTTGTTTRTSAYGVAPAGRQARPSTPQPATHGRFLESLRHLREQRWFRWLHELPDSLSEDVAPGPHRVAKELRSDLNRLDAQLRLRFY